jgi:hypothetical protein
MNLPVNYEKTHYSKRKLVREEYTRLQNGNCYHCKSSLDEEPPKFITRKKINESLFPPFFLKHPVHLHHSHDTGMTIGSVHAYCNAVLWQYHGE